MRNDMFEDAPYYGSAKFPAPRPFQDSAHDSLRKGVKDGHRCQVVMAPTGAGKCLGKDTPVLMADGRIKSVQDVVAGDKLMGPDGEVRNVLSTASGKELLYKITPNKGDSYIVNASHILSLKKTFGSDGLIFSDGTFALKNDDIVNINVEVFNRSNQTAKHCLKGWRSNAIRWFARDHIDDESERTIPAYLLGAWLGDGTAGRAQITKPFCNLINTWIKYGESIGHCVSKIDGNARCPSWHITSGRNGYSFNVVASYLSSLGILKIKRIPDCYKFSSLDTRRELLAGLIDSDGHITHNGVDWISKSKDLALDFAFVCRSVGLSCYLSLQKKGIAKTGFIGEYWRASVSGDLSEIPTKDKIASKRLQKKRHLVHAIKIEEVGFGDYYGFEIDGDRLFLLGDFTVTHNTMMAMRVAHEALLKNKKVTFVCDRSTLINQTSDVAFSLGLSAHGVIQSNHPLYNLYKPFQIASVQTLARREWPRSDVVIIDEVHTMYKGWTDYVKDCKATVIGLSATPFSKGLGQYFTNLINAATMDELTKQGHLVPMRVFSCKEIDMRGAATVGGEWSDGAAAERGMEIIGDVVSEWKQYGENRKTIVFCPTIAYANELCESFNNAGVMSATYTGETTEAERKMLLDEYKKPDSMIRILLSVEALAKGFDVKDVSCVVDCRPFRKSLSSVIQMWGRGLRSSPDTGKTDCILLDHSGNIVRFREDFEEIYFNGLETLDSGEKLDKVIRKDKEEKEPKGCPSCGVKPFFKHCVSCGFEIVDKSGIGSVAGMMQEIVIGNKKAANNRHDLWMQIATYAKAHAKPDKQKARASCIYKDIVGTWPPMHWEFSGLDNVVISPALINKIRSNNIAYAKRKQGGTQ